MDGKGNRQNTYRYNEFGILENRKEETSLPFGFTGYPGEAKYGSSKLSTLADETPQISDKWIIDRLENAVGEEIANDIKMEMILNPDNVGSSLVHISPDGNINVTELIDGVKK